MNNNTNMLTQEEKRVENEHLQAIPKEDENEFINEYEALSPELRAFISILKIELLNENDNYEQLKVERELRSLIFPFLIPCRRFLRRNKYICNIICPLLILIMYFTLHLSIFMVTSEEYCVYLRFPFYIKLSSILFRTLLKFTEILPEYIAEKKDYWLSKCNKFIVFFNFAFLINSRIMIHSELPTNILYTCIQIIIFMINSNLAFSYLPIYHKKNLLPFKFIFIVLYFICLIFFANIVLTNIIFIIHFWAELFMFLINFISFLTLHKSIYWSDNCFSLLFSLYYVSNKRK
ncbi:hypothetical protein TUBRATIS_19320 [Tubulinosema ratisbonensis]|uniref:Uncharacterized protein n=1 Tax=Tubulinosema ratisbonensis TaxID=291195 RepID=A0A437AKG8_9MICR|nr:hypothetical protein TUBRATIS_19320 [Tubulinosema ratisbonensis]